MEVWLYVNGFHITYVLRLHFPMISFTPSCAYSQYFVSSFVNSTIVKTTVYNYSVVSNVYTTKASMFY